MCSPIGMRPKSHHARPLTQEAGAWWKTSTPPAPEAFDVRVAPLLIVTGTLIVCSEVALVRISPVALKPDPVAVIVARLASLYKRYGIEPSTPSQDSDSKKAKNTVAIIWKLHPDNTLEPVQLSLGITDHEFTQVLAVTKGQLNKGDDVVIRSLKSDTPAPGTIRR